ncbi:hypothetical protein C8F01DRAFT_1257080 [Mycena amicta]|nr:hypothetical protein C8F01DRAFT_1257080 [Mycena amicta]
MARTVQVHIPELDLGSYLAYAQLPARLYHAAFGAKDSEWAYTGLRGSLVFGRDLRTVPPVCWFRLLDSKEGKTIWMFKMPEGKSSFNYQIDKPFFHVFRAWSRKFGFLFTGEDDREAEELAIAVKANTSTLEGGRVITRSSTESSMSALAAFTSAVEFHLPRSLRSRIANVGNRSVSLARTTTGTLPQAPTAVNPGKLNFPGISTPRANSFVHVAHVGRRNNVPASGGRADAGANVRSGESELEEAWMMVGAANPADVDGEFGFRPPTVFLEQHDIADGYMKTPSLSLRPAVILPRSAKPWPEDSKMETRRPPARVCVPFKSMQYIDHDIAIFSKTASNPTEAVA